MVLGVSRRMLPHVFGFPAPGRRLSLCCLIGLNLAVVGEASALVLMRLHSHAWAALWYASVHVFAWCVDALVRGFRLFGRVGESDRSLKFVRAAYAWLLVSLGMLVALPPARFVPASSEPLQIWARPLWAAHPRGSIAGRTVAHIAADGTLANPAIHEDAMPMKETIPDQGAGASVGRGTGPDVPGPPGFELLEEIGRGGMGVVFRARDLTMRREVAVKILQDHFAPASSTAARFLDEARITGQLQHPGIPAVYQVGALPDGRPFLAMKLIKGQTLEARPADGPPLDVLAVFEAVCQAVGYAHAHDVMHRDLKPANLMVGAFGEVQVMDWGLAKYLPRGSLSPPRAAGDAGATAAVTAVGTPRETDGGITQAGSVLGTPAYMSPEQAAGEIDKVDARSDVFGLGAILCALLTGRPPFGGADAESVRLNAVRGRTDDALARLDACGADPDVVALCKRCLAFEPHDRPATANEVAAVVAGLRRAADERAAKAELDKAKAEVRAAEQQRHRRFAIGFAGAVIAVLAAGVAVSAWQATVARREAHRAELARADADRRRAEAEAAYTFARESLVQVGTDLPAVLEQAIYTREAQTRATEVLAEALAKQLDPTAVRGLSGRAKIALHLRAGDALASLGKQADAERHYAAALEISTRLLEAGGEEAGLAKGNHALVQLKLAVAERAAKRTAEGANAALDQLAGVERLQRELLTAPPPDRPLVELRQSVAGTLLERVTTYRMLQQDDRALGPCREAIELLRPRPDDPPATRYTRDRRARLAGAYSQLAAIETARQADREAEDALREAVRLTAEARQDDPRNPLARLAAARAARELGDFLLMRDRLDDSASFYAQDIAAFRGVMTTPELLSLRFELGDAYYRTATLALKRKDAAGAADQYARCRALWQEVMEAQPTNRNRLAVGLVQARLGDHEAAAVFARQLLGGRKYSIFEGIQAVSVLALCGGATAGETRRRYFDESLAGLHRLVDALGYKGVLRLKTDPDLDPIRDDPGFQAIVRKLEAVAPAKGK
jgi:tetratricopeptide (TPR) repeat protein